MKIMFYYLVQVIIISGILYGYYHFFLRNKKFHQYNRYYLLAATLVSLFLPLLNIPIYFSTKSDIVPALQTLDMISTGNFEDAVAQQLPPAEIERAVRRTGVGNVDPVEQNLDVVGECGRKVRCGSGCRTDGARPVTQNAVDRLPAGFLCLPDAMAARVMRQPQTAVGVVAIVRMRRR